MPSKVVAAEPKKSKSAGTAGDVKDLSLAPKGKARIEWADGGLSRDRASTETMIGEAVTRYVAARRGDTPA